MNAEEWQDAYACTFHMREGRTQIWVQRQRSWAWGWLREDEDEDEAEHCRSEAWSSLGRIAVSLFNPFVPPLVLLIKFWPPFSVAFYLCYLFHIHAPAQYLELPLPWGHALAHLTDAFCSWLIPYASKASQGHGKRPWAPNWSLITTLGIKELNVTKISVLLHAQEPECMSLHLINLKKIS